jgi:3-dehydroquinate synthase
MDRKEAERIGSLIDAYGLPSKMPSGVDEQRMISSLQLDKKAVAGELKFVLPERIGSVVVRGVRDSDKVLESMRSR